MAELTRRRLGEIQRAIFQVLLEHPDGLPVHEVFHRAEGLCPPSPFDNEEYPNRPGLRRYTNTQRFATIPAVKAGWLIKAKGVWRLTERGRAAFAEHTDAEEFQRAAI